MSEPVADAKSPARVPRLKRAEVRKRLLRGAMDAFSDDGFQLSSIDSICTRAGLSRGAFYSNFTSKDELVFALYDIQIAVVGERIDRAVSAYKAGAEIEQVLIRALNDRNADELKWDIIVKEFILHALRNDTARVRFLAHRQMVVDRIVTALSNAFPQAMHAQDEILRGVARAIIALHEGTATECALEPDRARSPTLEAMILPRLVKAMIAEL